MKRKNNIWMGSYSHFIYRHNCRINFDHRRFISKMEKVIQKKKAILDIHYIFIFQFYKL